MRTPTLTLVLALAAAACRPSDILNVPPPASVLGTGALQNKNGAELLFNAGQTQFFQAVQGGTLPLLIDIGWFTDEFEFRSQTYYAALYANMDARVTLPTTGQYRETQAEVWSQLLQARLSLEAATPVLKASESGDGLSKVGESDALTGFSELFIAENFCAGTPFSDVRPGGVVTYGMPLSTDSIQAVALSHFTAAATETHGDPTITSLAALGRARLLVDRNQLSEAATAVANVPTSFEYDAVGPISVTMGEIQDPSVYWYGGQGNVTNIYFTVADTEGKNGLNFASAHDPRLTFGDTTVSPLTGQPPLRIPAKFLVDPSSLPLFTGIEARLIEAEAALASGKPGVWLSDLNALRASAQVRGQTGMLDPLVDPGSDTARVSLMFRERAFWLFGTGTRLDDLRRLVRQYGRPAETVYPTGPYAANHPVIQVSNPIANYGTDVVLALPDARGFNQQFTPIAETNPNYRGCIEPTTVP